MASVRERPQEMARLFLSIGREEDRARAYTRDALDIPGYTTREVVERVAGVYVDRPREVGGDDPARRNEIGPVGRSS